MYNEKGIRSILLFTIYLVTVLRLKNKYLNASTYFENFTTLKSKNIYF